jgi:hypothetical protein
MEKGTANLTFKSLDKVLRIHGMTIEQLFITLVSENGTPVTKRKKTKGKSALAQAQR